MIVFISFNKQDYALAKYYAIIFFSDTEIRALCYGRLSRVISGVLNWKRICSFNIYMYNIYCKLRKYNQIYYTLYI